MTTSEFIVPVIAILVLGGTAFLLGQLAMILAGYNVEYLSYLVSAIALISFFIGVKVGDSD